MKNKATTKHTKRLLKYITTQDEKLYKNLEQLERMKRIKEEINIYLKTDFLISSKLTKIEQLRIIIKNKEK